jgi:hypothetical protein
MFILLFHIPLESFAICPLCSLIANEVVLNSPTQEKEETKRNKLIKHFYKQVLKNGAKPFGIGEPAVICGE